MCLGMKSLQLMLLLAASFQCFEACSDSQYLKSNKCCNLCGPGYYMSVECTGGNETICLPCKSGEFQSSWNRETSCHQHDYCDQNAGKMTVKEGTTESNVACSCQTGRHCSSQSCETCVLNSVCGPGYGVVQTATMHSDTKCELCAEGTFSNISSDTEPCKAWSRCSHTQTEDIPGSSTSDVSCLSISVPRSEGVNPLYAFFLIPCLLVLGGLLWMLYRRVLRKQPFVKETNQKMLLENPNPNHHQVPEENNDPVIPFSMQGLPVAQEQGKDSRMSQEEV
ncbi:tumor necrosis factor receptor superfamily member 5 [Bombina bombina]|uniref:tumor necrosis factor receptor superfamily member 5 n=1 Tax=Bombina bombina TaxID=8345 RepID=UPI00235B08B7|nr:tumor necrosis factor receptor superfamily member 5 [Bombina bombina]